MKLFNKQNNYSALRIKQKAFLLITLLTSLTFSTKAQTNTSKKDYDDTKLVEEYIKSKAYSFPILFDASNIKQFWIDKSVTSSNNIINIVLQKSISNIFTSIPLKIQLKNVSAAQDCLIDVITENADMEFQISNSDKNIIASSESKEKFIDYSVVSSRFHMEDILDNSFSVIFSSPNSSVSIKKIILSFANNEEIIQPVNNLRINSVKLQDRKKEPIFVKDQETITMTGRYSEIMSTDKIIVNDNTIVQKVTITNSGKVPAHLYCGYVPYTKDCKQISNANTPYKGNKVFKVLSFSKENKTIMIDAYPEWREGSSLVANAKKDLSDFPNFDFIGKIQNVVKTSDGHAEITLKDDISTSVSAGDLVRVQDKSIAIYLYTNTKVLQPGETVTLHSKIRKNDRLNSFSHKEFSRGTEYVVPVILSFSEDNDEDNTIQISNYEIIFYSKK